MRFLHLCILSSSFFLRTVTRDAFQTGDLKVPGTSRSTFLVLSSFSRNFSAASRSLSAGARHLQSGEFLQLAKRVPYHSCFKLPSIGPAFAGMSGISTKSAAGPSAGLTWFLPITTAERRSINLTVELPILGTQSRASFTDRYLLSFFRQTSVTSCCHLCFVHFQV